MSGMLLLVVLATVPESSPGSRVAATLGRVTVERGGRIYTARPSAEIQTGDRLETGPDSGATVLLDADYALDLGPATRAALTGGPAAWAVTLERGEVRVTSAAGPVTVAAGPVRARAGRAIVRAAVGSRGARVWTEEGSVAVMSGARDLGPLADGQEVSIATAGAVGNPRPVDPAGWTIRPDGLRLAAAAAASRRRKHGLAHDANETTARAFQASGQAGVPPTPEGEEAPTEPTPTPETPAEPTTPAPPTTPTEETLEASSSLTQPTGVSTISLALGNLTTASAFGASGGLFSDAQQDTLNPAFPGNIYLVTAQTQSRLLNIPLHRSDNFPTMREYWSIGVGTPPTQQVVTTFRTASDSPPMTIPIPRTNTYLIRSPQSQYGIPDPATATLQTNASGALGIAGLLGVPPTAPQVLNATPLTDPRAQINDRATFALGEFALQRDLNRHGQQVPRIDLRRGDQDRAIIKSPTGNDNLDIVQPNPQINFINVPDPKFFPELPTVKAPDARPGQATFKTPPPMYARLDRLRQAAVTTLLADRLASVARRTGQTRFTLDNRTVIDITGYRGQGRGLRPFPVSNHLLNNASRFDLRGPAARGPLPGGR
jgi:hypothetical protein